MDALVTCRIVNSEIDFVQKNWDDIANILSLAMSSQFFCAELISLFTMLSSFLGICFVDFVSVLLHKMLSVFTLLFSTIVGICFFFLGGGGVVEGGGRIYSISLQSLSKSFVTVHLNIM